MEKLMVENILMDDLLLRFREAIAATNEFLELNLRKFQYITQYNDGSIMLFEDAEKRSKSIGFYLNYQLVELSKRLDWVYPRSDVQIAAYGKIWLDDNGYILYSVLAEEKPPQKHRQMINEWIDSGGKKRVQQQERDGKWTYDPFPTWLADNYRFEPEMVELEFTIYVINAGKGNCVVRFSVYPVEVEDQIFIRDNVVMDGSSWGAYDRDNSDRTVYTTILRKMVKRVDRVIFKEMVMGEKFIISLPDFHAIIESKIEKYMK
jgi:hypothetical protein